MTKPTYTRPLKWKDDPNPDSLLERVRKAAAEHEKGMDGIRQSIEEGYVTDFGCLDVRFSADGAIRLRLLLGMEPTDADKEWMEDHPDGS